MFRRTGWFLVVCACNAADPVTPPPAGDDDDDHELPTAIDTGTAPVVVERPEFACFADVTYDDGRDGVIDGTGFDGYDADNPTWLMYSDRDTNGNGLLEYITFYERDANGNATLTDRQRSGAQTVAATFDDRGNLLSQIYDYGADGVVDVAYTYTYDANDEVLHYEEDIAGDGNPELVQDYVRTPEGLRVSRADDIDGDGDIDTMSLYTQDDVGRVSLVSIDDGNDGVIEGVATYTYTDPVLQVGGYVYVEGDDGVADEIAEFAYDEAGRQMYYAYDTSPDGIWDQEQTSTRDADGRTLTFDVVVGSGSSGYDYTFTYAYDALGRTVQSTLIYHYGSGEIAIDEQYDTTFGGSCP